MSGWTGLDFSKHGPDEPILHSRQDAQTSALEAFTIADPDRVWTVREIAKHAAVGGRGHAGVRARVGLKKSRELAHHCRASCAPFWTSARAACAARRPRVCWAPRRLRSTMMPLWLLVWRGLPCWISGLTSVKWLTPIGGLLAPFRPPPALVQSRSLVFLGDLVHAGWTGASTKPVFWVGHQRIALLVITEISPAVRAAIQKIAAGYCAEEAPDDHCALIAV